MLALTIWKPSRVISSMGLNWFIEYYLLSLIGCDISICEIDLVGVLVLFHRGSEVVPPVLRKVGFRLFPIYEQLEVCQLEQIQHF